MILQLWITLITLQWHAHKEVLTFTKWQELNKKQVKTLQDSLLLYWGLDMSLMKYQY